MAPELLLPIIVVFAAVAAAVLGLAIAPGAAHAQWVGLGDSFAAGPLIPSQTLNPLGCLRSTRNFARLAAALGCTV